jgi:hypothetical protein
MRGGEAMRINYHFKIFDEIENIYIYIYTHHPHPSFLNLLRDNFTNTPQTLPTFAGTPLIFKNSHLPPLNFQKLSLTPLHTN